MRFTIEGKFVDIKLPDYGRKEDRALTAQIEAEKREGCQMNEGVAVDLDVSVGAILRLQMTPADEIAAIEGQKRGDNVAVTVLVNGRQIRAIAETGLPAGSYRIVSSDIEAVN